ncbi:DUF4179 domain-containing protein [Sporolactobacillus shoreae]|uniref:DUF4179 domain-containing protein n=2 Tax=Sporolactobacillus shoreae TaxID=1465501 RepID=A0A4Z0GRV8_9BACL|nr:DUF4179 domain-containing protein [Sporolactobacillus shoreae]
MMPDFEKEMERFSKAFDHTPESEHSEQAITLGIERARSKAKRNRRMLQVATVAAAVILLFFSSVKISPAFAAYVAKLPGLNQIVFLINGDRGLKDAVNHHALQQLNLSETKGRTTFTINSMIADQNQMILFYTIRNPGKNGIFAMSKIDVKNTSGESVMGHAGLDSDAPTKKNSVVHQRLTISFKNNKLTDPLYLSIRRNAVSWRFTIPFDIKKFERMKKSYPIHQTAVLQGQKINFESMTIYPTRIAIRVKYDPNNTKKITALDDLRIVDGNGHQWKPIVNGLESSEINSNEQILYFQSNYFSEPKSLYLMMTHARAIDKNMRNVVVDPVKKKLMKKPKDGWLTLKSIQTVKDRMDETRKDQIVTLSLRWPKRDANIGYQIFASTFTDQTGKTFTLRGMGTAMIGDTRNDLQLIIADRKYKGPLTFKIIDYPSRIYGNVRIKIK